MANRKPVKRGQNRRGASGPTSAQKRLAAERASAARQRIADAQRRRRLLVVAGSVGAVLAVVAVLVVVKLVTGAGDKTSGKKATAAAAAVLRAVGSVPPATFDKIGVGSSQTPPTPITAPPLTHDGKPEVLYIGAEYCPYCAAERWAVAVALSRFGTLHGVGELTSAGSPEVYPHTATLSFHNATYTSSELAFVAKELESNQVVDNNYAPLDSLTSAEQAVEQKYNAPGGGIPFVDLAGRYRISGAGYDPQLLQGKSQAQIAAALKDPNSQIAKGIDGTANFITAALCQSTQDKPADVCSSAGVKAAAAKLPGSSQ